LNGGHGVLLGVRSRDCPTPASLRQDRTAGIGDNSWIGT
jgi:hypothetical protein